MSGCHIMKNMGYKEAYHSAVTGENLEKIRHILNEHKYYDEITVGRIVYEEKDGLPYFILYTDSPKYMGTGNFAMLDGIFVKISSVVPKWGKIFYLPILIVREIKNEKLKPLINQDMFKEHELHHLRYITEHIDKHPDYIEKSMIYNAGSCTADGIGKSIAFEVEKLFAMELPAFASDYEKGERDYYFYDDGFAFTATAHDIRGFVQCNLAQYIANLHAVYIGRFPEKEAEIIRYMKNEVNRQGEKFFGKDAIEKLAIALARMIYQARIEGKRYELDESCL